MDDLFEEIEPAAARPLAAAALERFAERGFHGTTTRDIGARAGLSPASVYVHFPSKGELLFRISRIGHASALEALEGAAGDEPDPRERVRRLVCEFAVWHARHHRLARVVQYENGSLPQERRAEIDALRARFAPAIERELERGMSEGALDVAGVQATARAVLSLCIDIARWYNAESKLTPEEIGTIYADLVLRMVDLGHGAEAPAEAPVGA